MNEGGGEGTDTHMQCTSTFPSCARVGSMCQRKKGKSGWVEEEESCIASNIKCKRKMFLFLVFLLPKDGWADKGISLPPFAFKSPLHQTTTHVFPSGGATAAIGGAKNK